MSFQKLMLKLGIRSNHKTAPSDKKRAGDSALPNWQAGATAAGAVAARLAGAGSEAGFGAGSAVGMAAGLGAAAGRPAGGAPAPGVPSWPDIDVAGSVGDEVDGGAGRNEFAAGAAVGEIPTTQAGAGTYQLSSVLPSVEQAGLDHPAGGEPDSPVDAAGIPAAPDPYQFSPLAGAPAGVTAGGAQPRDDMATASQGDAGGAGAANAQAGAASIDKLDVTDAVPSWITDEDYKTEEGTPLKDRFRTTIEEVVKYLGKLTKLVERAEGAEGSTPEGRALLRGELSEKVRGVVPAASVPIDTREAMLHRLHELVEEQREFIKRQAIPINGDDTLDTAKLDQRTVEYDRTPAAQKASTVTISGGRLLRDPTHQTKGAPVDTSGGVTHFRGAGHEIFVVGPSGDIHMGSHKVGQYHHSSLLAGSSVVMAGEMKVTDGRVEYVSNKSGHYLPSRYQMTNFLKALQSAGVPLDFRIEIMGLQLPPDMTAARFLGVDSNGTASNRTAPRLSGSGYAHSPG